MKIPYKLIKEYPGSPPLNTLYELDINKSSVPHEWRFPEFWERQLPPEHYQFTGKVKNDKHEIMFKGVFVNIHSNTVKFTLEKISDIKAVCDLNDFEEITVKPIRLASTCY